MLKVARKSFYYIHDRLNILHSILIALLNAPHPEKITMSAPFFFSLPLSLTLFLQASQCWSQLQFQTEAEINTSGHKVAFFRDMSGEGYTLCRKGAELGRAQRLSESISDLVCELFDNADDDNAPVAFLTRASDAISLTLVDLDSSLEQWPEDVLEPGTEDEVITGAFNYRFPTIISQTYHSNTGVITLGFSTPLADRLPPLDAFGLHCQGNLTGQPPNLWLLDVKKNIDSVSLTNAHQTLRIELPDDATAIINEPDRTPEQCVITYEPLQYYNNAYLTDTKGYPVNTFYLVVKNGQFSYRTTGPLNSMEGCSRALENTEDSARYCEYTVTQGSELVINQPNSTMPTITTCRQLVVYGEYENGFLTGAYPEDIPDNQMVSEFIVPTLPILRVLVNRNNKDLPSVYDYRSFAEFFGFFDRASKDNNPAGCSADGVKFAIKIFFPGEETQSNAVLCYREREGEREWGYAWKTVYAEGVQGDLGRRQRENPLEQRFCYSFSLPASGNSDSSETMMVAPTYFIADGFVAIGNGTLMESDISTVVDVFFEDEDEDEGGGGGGANYRSLYITIGAAATAGITLFSTITISIIICNIVCQKTISANTDKALIMGHISN